MEGQLNLAQVPPCTVTATEASEALKAYYTTGSLLKVERLSGKILPMESCYINLAVVRLDDTPAPHKSQSSPFSLTRNVGIELDGEDVKLCDLFNSINLSNGEKGSPKRILIRGRAGVGKSTLCKKIVHEYIHNGMWNQHFDWLVWVPLRILKNIETHGPYTLGDLFTQYFSTNPNTKDLAECAWRTITGPAKDRTLFVLDGLDEVFGQWNEGEPIQVFLDSLLAQDYVIITTRPYTLDRERLEPIDLELETIGFRPEQVMGYLENKGIVPEIVTKEIQFFLEQRPIVRELVLIPIQLDALCHSWGNAFKNEAPETMTEVYLAIVNKLWSKDRHRLQRANMETEKEARESTSPESKEEVKEAMNLIEGIAFDGIYNNKVEFGKTEWDQTHRFLKTQNMKSPGYAHLVLGKLSFLCTSDTTLKEGQQKYRFLHLTFQEFFAARHFVRHWLSNKPLLYQGPDGSTSVIIPKNFLQERKYDARYDIMWRFVAGLFHAGWDQGMVSNTPLNLFFQELEAGPRDFLGPTHQRLIMHCLSEVAGTKRRGTLECRERLESRLLRWVNFEWELCKTTELLSEPEFPVSGITTLLRDDSHIGREHVLRIVSMRPRLSEDTLSIITLLLNDKDVKVKKAAAEALKTQSNLPQAALDRLFLLPKNSRELREVATYALEKQPSIPQAILDRIILLLKHEHPGIRDVAARALVQQSNLPQATLDELILLLKDKTWESREAIIEPLRWQPPQVTLNELVSLYKDKNWEPREAAIKVLERKSTLPTLNGLILLLNDKNQEVREAIVKALKGQLTLPQATLDGLILLLKDGNWRVRWAAAEALRIQPTIPQAALDGLILLLKDEDKMVRQAATKALEEKPTLPQPTLDRLILLLKDKNQEVRWTAAKVLEKQSTLPQSALDGLILLLEDENEEVRRSAFISLRANEIFTIMPTYTAKLPLFRCWLAESFTEQISIYQHGDTLILNTPEKLKCAQLDSFSHSRFLWDVQQAQAGLETPLEYDPWIWTLFWDLFQIYPRSLDILEILEFVMALVFVIRIEILRVIYH
ncbi:hypothetical protein MGYG_05209 [Nannizzia gypsea CBS 118893]|uniref:NACHT domain-containing protein n=1 Tax=Arthroderma gypseum (strain ATCC MYA-4604 / CBS 118893) TaxID=535722 RepID=E4UV79_ARTGP|nr:hypothetical protein MGYG_05209 [Nannizzia gypsea CBS 118893]EFR02206.1 hypothetical protein MGYG_05209 [Nannizzia gypsea CBS 118893]